MLLLTFRSSVLFLKNLNDPDTLHIQTFLKRRKRILHYIGTSRKDLICD